MTDDYCGACGLVGGGDALGCTAECDSPSGRAKKAERASWMRLLCDACPATATMFADTAFGRMKVCCEKHKQGAIDALLDHDEELCAPVPRCGCEVKQHG